MFKIAVITVSDRASAGEYADASGPTIRALIKEKFPDAAVSADVIPDDKETIKKTIAAHLDCDFIFTTGGTGISPRDVTPEATAEICQKELPGISEWLRQESLAQTEHAVFSRAFAGIRDQTIIVNFPGSVKGAELCARLMIRVMAHGHDMLRGGKH